MKFFSETKTKIALICGVSFLTALLPLFMLKAATRDELQQRLNQIRSEISKYQAAYLSKQKEARSLSNEVKLYEDQISATELELQAKATQIEDSNLQIKALGEEIELDDKKIKNNQAVLGQLIIQLHQLDNNSFLSMSLNNNSFSDFLDQIQYTTSVGNQVSDVVVAIKEVKQKLEQQQADLRVQVTRLEELQQELQITQDALADQRQNKQALFDQTKNSEAAYQRLLATSQQQEADLEKEMRDLDSKAKRPTNVIRPSKGLLGIPMDGVFTQGYGNTGFTALGYNFHNGVDIAAPAGTPIYSAADGTVVACDTGEAAYGNWCAIKSTIKTKDGNRQIVSLYAHMRSFKVSAGKTVKRGDLVGHEGNTGNTTRLIYGSHRGYHLHYTVFDAEGFGIQKGQYSNIYGAYRVPYGYTYNPMSFF